MAPPLLRNVVTKGLRWRLLDAKDLVVGRVASQIAHVLQGKDKPTYAPNKDEGDVVVVVNARHVKFTGDKMKEKVYYWHTGYPGGIKQRTPEEWMKRDPTEVLRMAVLRMLPKNRLQKERARKLRLFPDGDHPFPPHLMTPFPLQPQRHQQGSSQGGGIQIVWYDSASGPASPASS
eukprot:jgi/Chlat1/5982/Chrsp4S06300